MTAFLSNLSLLACVIAKALLYPGIGPGILFCAAAQRVRLNGSDARSREGRSVSNERHRMTLPTEQFVPNSVGTEDGVEPDHAVLEISPPDPWLYQDNRYCERCGGLEIVIFAWRFAGGRLGVCLGCGKPVPEPDTRTNSEAA